MPKRMSGSREAVLFSCCSLFVNALVRNEGTVVLLLRDVCDAHEAVWDTKKIDRFRFPCFPFNEYAKKNSNKSKNPK